MRRLRQTAFFGGGGSSNGSAAGAKRDREGAINNFLTVAVIIISVVFILVIVGDVSGDNSQQSYQSPSTFTSSDQKLGVVSSGNNKAANVPNFLFRPWQWGLRAPVGSGGNEDAELTSVSPQGTPQVLVEEASLVDESPNLAREAAIKGEVDILKKRYYDSADLLWAFQKVRANQHRFTNERAGRQAKPIQEIRSYEDELRIPYQW